MQTRMHQRYLRLFSLLVCGIGLIYTKAQAQIAPDLCANAQTFTIGQCNVPFNIQIGATNSVYDCEGTLTEGDGWATFQATATAPVVIQYTNLTGGLDAALTVYKGNCGGDLLNCVNNVINLGTETVTINAQAGVNYYIKVSNLTDGTKALQGNLCIYNGGGTNEDICADAVPLGIGTCDYEFTISPAFINNEGLPLNCIGETPFLDAWVSFTADANQTVGIEFNNGDKNAALAVYSGTCGSLVLQECSDFTEDAPGKEFIEFEAPSTGTYFLRIMNIEDNGALSGDLCLYEVIARDDCADAIPALSLGTCNRRFDVNASYTPSGAPNCAGVSNNRDAWVTFSVPNNTEVQLDYISSNSGLPDLAIYDGNCGTLNLVACEANAGRNSNSLAFSASAGVTYYARVVSSNNNRMEGNICLSERGNNQAENYFFNAPRISVTSSNNTLPFNVFSFFNSNGALPSNLPDELSCSGTSVSDAWTSFESTTSEEIIISYNNSNNDLSVSENTALLLYKGARPDVVDANLTNFESTSCAGLGGVMTLPSNTLIENINITNTGFDAIGGAGNTYQTNCNPSSETPVGNTWITYNATAGVPFTVFFETDPTAAAQLEVYRGNGCDAATLTSLNTGDLELVNSGALGCEQALGAPGITSVTINPVASSTYRVRAINFASNGGAITGSLGVYTQLRLMSCRDIVREGTETITLVDPNPSPDSLYYIRVANLETGNSLGRLSIQRAVSPRDICSNADNLNNGDCRTNFNFTTDLDELQDINDPDCITSAGKNVEQDIWATLTAVNNEYVAEYAHQNADVAIAIYRGSCNGLVLVTCADGANDPDGIETATFSTVPGLQYFVRIMRVGPFTMAPNEVTGALCVRETEESDVCDPNLMSRIRAGDCNIRFDVPAAFGNSGTALRDESDGTLPGHYPSLVDPTFTCDIDLNATGGTRTPSRDAWVSMVGNGRVLSLQYQNNHGENGEVSDPAMVVYTALLDNGPINCNSGINGAGNVGNEYACVDALPTASRQTETVSFQTSPGRIYFVRIMDMSSSTTGMTGTLCLSEGDQINGTCAEADEIEIGECSIQLNVSSDPAGCSSEPTQCTGCQSDAWAIIRTPDSTAIGTGSLPVDNITVEYDNSGNTQNALVAPPDIALEIYTGSCGGLTRIDTVGVLGCMDEVPNGSKGIERVNFQIDPQGNEIYYVRVINKTPNLTAFGRMCVFYGKDIAEEICSDASSIGEIEGEWRSFEVSNTWTDEIVPTPSIDDPPCVISSSTIPVTSEPLIKSQAWFEFTVPPGSSINFNSVTIQYDNVGLVDGNPQNAAIAVYTVPTNTAPNCGQASEFIGGDPSDAANYINPNGLLLLECINAVWEGIESMTIFVEDGRTYYVRVMNVSSNDPPQNMPGRVRVFPYAPCNIGPELVKDGTFVGWDAIDDSSAPSVDIYANPETVPGEAYARMDTWVHPNPSFKTYGTDQAIVDRYARFATDYGYQKDVGTDANDNTQSNLWQERSELRTEGLYAVTHTAWNYKRNWFCYGHGHSGYGGGFQEDTGTPLRNLNPNYCEAGPQTATEACTEVEYYRGGFTRGVYGNPSPGLPSLIPVEAEANFMLVNGWFPDESQFDPGKIWCQTIEREPSPSGTFDVGYYVFTAWFQNVKSPGQPGEIPQLRVSICDMEDPLTPGNLASVGETAQTSISILPGTTKTAGSSPNPSPTTFTEHIPPPPNNADLTLPAPRDKGFFAYGAAMPCNTNDEAPNARLKILGSSFFLEQEPDEWQIIRCIYRAPENVREFNLCIENLSITKNGNDFAIDDISFRECVNPNVEAFENLLRGGSCELADSPDVILPALGVNLLDFTGKLIPEGVALNWVALTERELSHYEVERSLDGKNFDLIGEKAAQNPTSTLAEYNFLDIQIPEGQKYLYYRLKMFNLDGNFRLSQVVRVTLNPTQAPEAVLYPNPIPAGDVATFRFEAPQAPASLLISDLVGTVWSRKYFETQSGENNLKIHTQGLAPGIYIIKINFGNQEITKKLLVL